MSPGGTVASGDCRGFGGVGLSEYNQGILNDIAEIVMGQSPSGKTCNKSGIGVPLLNGPTEFGNRHPYPVQYTTDPKKLAQSGDLLFCVRGSTTGRMNWADQEYAIGRGVAAIRSHNGNDLAPFVRASIELQLPKLLNITSGSTFPNVSSSQLQNLPIYIPPLPTQRRIAQILGRLDDKIEVNRRINRTLEAMAQALYKQWFVEFGPFQDGPFVESEVGLIPEGWGIKPLEYFVEIDVTTTKPQDHPNEIFNHYSIPALGEQSYPVQDLGADVKSNKYAITSDRILVSKLNPRFYRIWTVYHKDDFRSFSSTEFINYVCQHPSTWSFMNCYFRSDGFIAEFRSRVTGTTGSRQRVKPKDTLSFPCIKPSNDTLEKFEKIISPYFSRIHHNDPAEKTQ